MGSSEEEALAAACTRFFDDLSRTDTDRLAVLTALLDGCSAEQWHALDSCFKSLQLDLHFLSSPPRPPKPAATATPLPTSAQRTNKTATRSAHRDRDSEQQAMSSSLPLPASPPSALKASSSTRPTQRVGKMVTFEAFAMDVGSGVSSTPLTSGRRTSIRPQTLSNGDSERRQSLVPTFPLSIDFTARRSSILLPMTLMAIDKDRTDAVSTDSSCDSNLDRSGGRGRDSDRNGPLATFGSLKSLLRPSLMSSHFEMDRSPAGGLSSTDWHQLKSRPSLKSSWTINGNESTRTSQSQISVRSLPASLLAPPLQQVSSARNRMRRPTVIPATSGPGPNPVGSRWHRLSTGNAPASSSLQQQLIVKRRKRADRTVSQRAELLVNAIREQAARGWAQWEMLSLVVALVKRAPVATSVALIDYVRPRLATRSHISRLSDDILLSIFRMLPVDGLLMCSQVCRRWKYLCSQDHLWVQKCRQIVFARAIPSKALIGELVERLAVERVPRSSLSLPLALSTARALALEQPATDALVDALGLEPPPPVPVKGLARGKKPLSAVLERAAEYADAVDGANSDSSSNSRSSSTSDEPDFGPQNKKPQRKGGRVRIQESQSAVRRHLRDRQRRRRRERPLPLLPLQWMHVCLSLQRLDLTPAAASKSVRSAPSGRTGAGVDIDREREGTGLDLENGQENVNGTASSEGTLDDVYVTRRRSSLDPERVQPVDTEKGNWALVASLAERQQSADKNGEGGDEMDMRLTRLAQQSSMRDLDGGTSKKGKSKKKNESTVFE